MEKIASTEQLNRTQLEKIATFMFATSFAAPVIGLGQAQVKSAAQSFLGGLQRATARHEKLVDMIRDHVKGGVHA